MPHFSQCAVCQEVQPKNGNQSKLHFKQILLFIFHSQNVLNKSVSSRTQWRDERPETAASRLDGSLLQSLDCYWHHTSLGFTSFYASVSAKQSVSLGWHYWIHERHGYNWIQWSNFELLVFGLRSFRSLQSRKCVQQAVSSSKNIFWDQNLQKLFND